MSSVRRAALVVILLIAVVPLAFPAVQAQGGSRYFDLQVRADGAQTIAERLGAVEIGINITVTPQQNAPINDQFRIIVTVNRSTPNPVPNGWAVGPLSEASFEMAPGETRHVSVRVALTTSDPEADGVSLTFNVQSQPVFMGARNPVTDALVRTMEAPDNAAAEAQVRRDLEPAEALTSFVFNYRWLLLAAAGVILVGGLLLVRRRTVGLTVRTDSPVQEIVPGRGASFPLLVQNLGNQKADVTVATSDVPPGWSAILPLERLQLGAGEASTIWLTLKSPPTARPGERIQVGFVATADGTPYESMVEAVVVERYGQPARPAPDESSAEDVELLKPPPAKRTVRARAR